MNTERHKTARQKKTMLKSILRMRLYLLFAIGFFVLNPVPVAVATTFAVDRTDDDASAIACNDAMPNDCSLRGAIIAANILAGADTIDLPAGTYARSISGAENNALAGDLDINESLTINGDGVATTIINAAGLGRVFDVRSGSVAITDVTLQGGSPEDGDEFGTFAGGIWVTGGSLTLTNVTISGCSASAGGGLVTEFETSVTGTHVTISGNTGFNNAGAILMRGGTITLMNSTLSGNLTGGSIGGVYGNGTSTFINSTVSGNQAAGLFGVGGTMNLNNVTVSNNGVGLRGNPGVPFNIKNTIVAGNINDCSLLSAGTPTLNSQGYNLIQNSTGAQSVAMPPATNSE